jgi:hypothetical protein
MAVYGLVSSIRQSALPTHSLNVAGEMAHDSSRNGALFSDAIRS